MLIKIYGERNTGTNYLEQLLRKHLPFLSAQGQDNPVMASSSIFFEKAQDLKQLGWKHRLIEKNFLQPLILEKHNALIVTITKNPYSWLLSLHKRPYAPIHLRTRVISFDENGVPRPHTDRNIKIIRNIKKLGHFGRVFLSRFPQWSEYEEISFGNFIRAKWFTQFNEGCGAGFKNPIELWNIKNKAYLELAKDYNVISLTYEELLASPKGALQKIAEILGCSLESFENIYSAAKKEDQGNGEKNYQSYQEYYLQEQWRKKLNSLDIRWISSQLDKEVMRTFGYQLL